MLLAHGTTEMNADIIEACGYFDERTYFLKLHPDERHALYGVAGFALREHPATQDYVDAYCKHDLVVGVFRFALERSIVQYIEEKRGDDSPGLIYIVEADDESMLDYHRYKGPMRNLFVPTELYSTEHIPTSAVRKVLTLEENVGHFSAKLPYPVEALEDVGIDPLLKRAYNSFRMRFERMVLKRK